MTARILPPNPSLCRERGGRIEGYRGVQSLSPLLRDCEKANAAVLAGWRVLRLTAEMITDGQAQETVTQLLEATDNEEIRR